MRNDCVVSFPPMQLAAGSAVGRAPAGASQQECEALLDEYDAVLVSDKLMITGASRLPKLTHGAVTTAMTDQLSAHLRDIEARTSEHPADNTAPRQP
jgi:hypothetical protein